jgi:hypothetical protein
LHNQVADYRQTKNQCANGRHNLHDPSIVSYLYLYLIETNIHLKADELIVDRIVVQGGKGSRP